MKVENCLQYGFDLFRHFTLSIGVLSGPDIDGQNSMTNSDYVTTFHPRSGVRCDASWSRKSGSAVRLENQGHWAVSADHLMHQVQISSDSGNLTSGNCLGDVGTRFRTGGGTVDGGLHINR
jgi:hypothetical protein